MRDNNDQFWNLVKPEHAAASAFCRKLTGSRDDGDDLYQDAIFRALTRFEQLRDHGSFRQWLYRIIVNCYRNRLSDRWWRRFLPLGPVHDNIPSQGNVERQVMARRNLEIAFKPLSAEDRALLILFEAEGWPVADLAEMSGQSVSAVKARLSRARKKSKSALERHLRDVTGANKKSLTGDEDSICVVTKRNSD